MKIKLYSAIILAVIFTSSCVEDLIYVGPPTISTVAINPIAPAPEDIVTVSANVTDLKGIKSVMLNYKIDDGAYVSIDMTGGPTFTATIPAQATDKSVYYYIEATNNSMIKQTTDVSFYKIGAPSILINEIFSRGVAGDVDWVEIYNNSDKSVNISGYKVYDSGGNDGGKPKMEAPAGTIMLPHGFYVFVVDDATTAFPVGSNFGLSSGGEKVWLENATGQVINQVDLPAVTDATHSYGRKPDGSVDFFFLTNRTKGASNNNSPVLAN